MASTPKNPLTTTPNRPNASPRPNLGTGAFGNKTVAAKSPAVKTPTPAPLHGHGHGHTYKISMSSYPTSTPLAASTLPDDLMNLNSPAAQLMASIGPTSLTPLPLPSTQDGLGISSGMIGAPSTQDGHASKNPQKERHDRLNDIAQTLKRKTQARGVSRHNVENLAKVNGFEPFYDEDEPDILNLFGKEHVVLDIVFKGHKSDIVEKARLKLNDPANGEEEVVQEDASQVLTRNLTQDSNERLRWHDLTGFSANLEYLTQVERVSTGSSTSCFKVIDGLYGTFQKIWIEEKKRMNMKWRHDLHHLCQSNIGEPAKDANRRLGLSVRYWTRGRNFYAKQEPKIAAEDMKNSDYRARFSVESGSPSVAASRRWLAEDTLISTVRAEDIFQESSVDKPSWQDPVSSQPEPANNADSMDVDPSPTLAKTLDMHFVCDFEPEILLPWHVVQSLRGTGQMLEVRSEQGTTYRQLLHQNNNPDIAVGARWTRPQYVFSKDGKQEERTHSYNLYTTGQYYVYPVRKLSFSHPRQFADVLPVLRQYALVNSLIHSIAPFPGVESNTPTTESAHTPIRKDGKELVVRDGKKLWVRSNKPRLESKLNSVMKPTAAAELKNGRAILIDVQLDTVSYATTTKTCRLDISVPISTAIFSRPAIERLKAKNFLKVEIEILLNGIVEVVNMTGVELDRQKLEDFKKRLSKVVRCSEDDLGTVVAWAIRELDSF